MTNKSAALSDNRLLAMFEGMFEEGKGPIDIRQHTKRVVRTRKEHSCPGLAARQGHRFKSGSRAVREHAIVDGAWRTSYSCEMHVLEWGRQCGEIE